MSELRTLLQQSSHYLGGRIAIMAAGVVSFPILTRLFAVGDYGLLGIITTTVFIASAVTKMGFPSASVRFYSEYDAQKRVGALYSTIFFTSVPVALALAVVISVAAVALGKTEGWDRNAVILVLVAAVLIVLRSTNDNLTSFLRAEQRTKLYNAITAISRYASLAAGIFFVVVMMKGLKGFLFGQVLVSFLMLGVLLFLSRPGTLLRWKHFSKATLRDSLNFGLPLIGAELGILVLNYADRYLIHYYLGSVPLGLYTAGYNLGTYVTDVVVQPINYAMVPIYMGILVNKGEEETRRFLTKTFRIFVLLIFPVMFGFIAVGKDLLVVLASDKYVGAAPVLSYVVLGQVMHASTLILNTGLFIRKKTHVVTAATIFACVANVALNVFLIPRYGIVGAAQATLVSYGLFAIVITYYSFKQFSFEIDFPAITVYLAVSGVMLLTIRNIHVGGHVATLISQVGTGVMLYSSLIFLLDREIRQAVLSLRKNAGSLT
ncbi:MAG: flippase [Nitrospirota bacterium]